MPLDFNQDPRNHTVYLFSDSIRRVERGLLREMPPQDFGASYSWIIKKSKKQWINVSLDISELEVRCVPQRERLVDELIDAAAHGYGSPVSEPKFQYNYSDRFGNMNGLSHISYFSMFKRRKTKSLGRMRYSIYITMFAHKPFDSNEIRPLLVGMGEAIHAKVPGWWDMIMADEKGL